MEYKLGEEGGAFLEKFYIGITILKKRGPTDFERGLCVSTEPPLVSFSVTLSLQDAVFFLLFYLSHCPNNTPLFNSYIITALCDSSLGMRGCSILFATHQVSGSFFIPPINTPFRNFIMGV